MTAGTLPLSDIDYGPDEEAAAIRVLRSRWLTMGPEVQQFEAEISAFLEVEHACAVSSGTAALHLAFLALGIGPGDEVIQPALNFVAAANMTVAIGATPVFADITGLDEPTLDPADLERRITRRTKAVVVMHYGGYPCRMAEINAICRNHGIAVVEDACHALGARYSDPAVPGTRRVGVLGDLGCFSFFGNKNLAVGEGGLVVTRRKDLIDRVRNVRSHGMTTVTWDRHRGHASTYDVIAHGFNYRFDELRAALARCQLRKLDRNNERRRDLVNRYATALADLPGWRLPFADRILDGAHHLFVALAPDGVVRDRVRAHLTTGGIQTSVHYPCITDLAAFGSVPAYGLGQSAAFARHAITLPLFAGMREEDVDRVALAVQAGSRRQIAES